MSSRIPCRMATVNGDENAVPICLESSLSESNTKNPEKGSITPCVILFKQKQQDQGSISGNLWF